MSDHNESPEDMADMSPVLSDDIMDEHARPPCCLDCNAAAHADSFATRARERG